MASAIELHDGTGVAIVGTTGIVFAYSATVPSSQPGYSKGCILIDTATGTIYRNDGTKVSCTFVALADA